MAVGSIVFGQNRNVTASGDLSGATYRPTAAVLGATNDAWVAAYKFLPGATVFTMPAGWTKVEGIELTADRSRFELWRHDSPSGNTWDDLTPVVTANASIEFSIAGFVTDNFVSYATQLLEPDFPSQIIPSLAPSAPGVHAYAALVYGMEFSGGGPEDELAGWTKRVDSTTGQSARRTWYSKTTAAGSPVPTFQTGANDNPPNEWLWMLWDLGGDDPGACACDLAFTDLGVSEFEPYGPGEWYVVQWDSWCGESSMVITEIAFQQIGGTSPPASPITDTGWTVVPGSYPVTVTLPTPGYGIEVSGGGVLDFAVLARIQLVQNDCEFYTVFMWFREVTDGVVDSYISVDGGSTWVDTATGGVLP